MRLIDAYRFENQMNEELLPKLIKEYGKEEALKGLHFSFRDCICNIQSQPTADAVSREKYEASEEVRDILVKFADDLLADLKERVEVTRCKDCKFGVYEKGRGIYHTRCEILEFLFQDDDYCSYGERKEE